MTKNENKLTCEYCGKVMGSRQSISRHRLNRPKRCYKLEVERKKEASLTLREPSLTILEPAVDPSHVEDEIMQLERKLTLLKMSTMSTEEREIMELKDKLARSVKLNEEYAEELKVYKPFYQKYMLKDVDTLMFYNPKEHSSELFKHLCGILENKDDMLTCLEPSLVYGYIFPKFWRLINCKDGVYKYKDADGKVCIDENLSHLYKTIKSVFLSVLNDIVVHISEVNGDRREEYEAIYWNRVITYDERCMFFYNDIREIDSPVSRKMNQDCARSLRKLLD